MQWKKLKQNKGFTLVEILVALIIFSSTAMILSNIRSGNLQRMEKIQHYRKAIELLENKMTELEFEWGKKALHTIPDSEEGDFENEKNFSWSVKTQALQLTDYQQLLSLAGEEVNNEMVQQVMNNIQQLLSSSILEVKLTVHFKQNTKQNSYSLSTYIVDYTQKPGFNLN